MLPWIVGVVVVGVGAYLLDDAKSENSRAKERYDATLKDTKNNIEKAYSNAEARDMLDKLHKAKRAKQKIFNSLYTQCNNTKSSFRQTNLELKKLKDDLSLLFLEKDEVKTREEKREIQQDINIIIQARKELFQIRDELKLDICQFEKKLEDIRKDIKNIYNDIKRLKL